MDLILSVTSYFGIIIIYFVHFPPLLFIGLVCDVDYERILLVC